MTRSDAISASVAEDVAADPVGAAAQARDWLVGCAAELMLVDAAVIDVRTPLAEYGLDSVTALALTAEIEDRFDLVLDAETLWSHPTVDALVAVIGALSAGR